MIDTCQGCGGPHSFDTSVPSVLWNAVVRKNGWADFLCIACIIKAFAAADQSFTATLWGREFNGLAIEVRINGQDARDVALIHEENNTLRRELERLQNQIAGNHIEMPVGEHEYLREAGEPHHKNYKKVSRG